MRITDDSDETFKEDMRYMRMLMDRIFRTAITQNLRLDDNGRNETEIAVGELEGTLTALDAADRPRDAHGRFVSNEKTNEPEV